ncbi:MAG TPA: hypothetical protein VD866_19220 [Urbifossiella sp.]|nr:hypothetical protein [Urbifossiella sp.]
MAHSIRIDDEVYEYLKANAEPYETPNTTLRRVLLLTPATDEVGGDEPSLDDLLAALEEPKAAKKSPFHAHLPAMSPRTVRHGNSPSFIALARAVNALIGKRFPGRFTTTVHLGSVSWLEGPLCMLKLNFHGQETGMFEGESDRLKCVFGLRREMADTSPDLGKLNVWDRRFQVAPDWAVWFVGFPVDNDPPSVAKVKQVIDALK